MNVRAALDSKSPMGRWVMGVAGPAVVLVICAIQQAWLWAVLAGIATITGTARALAGGSFTGSAQRVQSLVVGLAIAAVGLLTLTAPWQLTGLGLIDVVVGLLCIAAGLGLLLLGAVFAFPRPVLGMLQRLGVTMPPGVIAMNGLAKPDDDES